jgi:prepilin-type N-terminal cleavage/methylation domain-containing protein
MKFAEAKSNRSAFTLIELLMVIAIIGVIAALLLPALNRSKAAAMGAQCSNNHRQLILAWSMYVHDNNDQLPILEKWVAGNMQDPYYATNTWALVDPAQSALARYITVAQIYKCPGDPSVLVRSVSMNNRMNPTLPGLWLHGGGDLYNIFMKGQQIPSPSAIYVMTDERSDTINDSSLCVDMSNTGNADGLGASHPYWLIDYPAGYRDGSGRFSFVDGHVEGHHWQGQTLLVPLGQAHAPSSVAATDPDVKWLQDHCTQLK